MRRLRWRSARCGGMRAGSCFLTRFGQFVGAGDACDPDIDADGVLNKFAPCPFTALGVAVDADGRSLGAIDLDCDTDLDDYRLF